MNSEGAVQIEITLPELGETPLEKTQLTKTGKLSFKKMTQRDRVAMYTDLCTGIALRLIYETFRVLRIVESVEVFGTASGIDPATGNNVDFVALYLRTETVAFRRINLEAADASSAFELLGGTFACDKRGYVKSIPGIEGLLNA